MAITKTYKYATVDGAVFENINAFINAYLPPDHEGEVDGITSTYTLDEGGASATRTMTFADEATYNAWNSGTPWSHANVTKSIQE